MALAIDITNGCGPSNKMLLNSESSENVFSVHLPVKASFKSGHAVRVAKLIKTDRLVVLQ